MGRVGKEHTVFDVPYDAKLAVGLQYTANLFERVLIGKPVLLVSTSLHDTIHNSPVERLHNPLAFTPKQTAHESKLE